jgi:hypothetical protein
MKGLFSRQPKARLELLKRMPRDSVCAEIGVWKGDFSREILRRTSPRRLHLIDPWEFQSNFPNRKFGGKHAQNQRIMDRIFEGVVARFEDLPNVSIHRAYSREALEGFEDGHFDWLYLDGNHAFDYVWSDLNLGFAKVRSGGFITGDDYTWGRKCGFPVEKAVQQFVREKAMEDRLEIIGSQYIIGRP